VVKEGRDELDGCGCVPSLDELEEVDVLVVGVAAEQVPELLGRVTRDGLARSVILVSSGLEADAVESVRSLLLDPHAPVVNGGNCLGIRSRPGRYDTLFLPPWKMGFPPPAEDGPHPVALVTQSGAFAVARTSALPWLDPRYLVTVGNQLDLTVGDYVEAFLDDPGVRVVAAYVEGFRPGDGRRFLEAARRHRDRGGTVLLYRAGRTPEGADAMASHTESLAGDYAVTRALALSEGVLLADTVQEFQELLALAVRLDGRVPSGAGAGMVSNAGFECVAMADSAGELSPVALSHGTRAGLQAILDDAGLGTIVEPRNPLDLTPILPDEPFARAVELLLADPGVEVGVVGCVPLTPALQTLPPGPGHGEDATAADALAARLGRIWRETRKPWVAVVDGGPRYDPFVRALERHGMPVLRNGDRAVTLVGRWVRARRRPPAQEAPSGVGARIHP
jgi:acyl-CoA synthetase (NDP forming)